MRNERANPTFNPTRLDEQGYDDLKRQWSTKRAHLMSSDDPDCGKVNSETGVEGQQLHDKIVQNDNVDRPKSRMLT